MDRAAMLDRILVPVDFSERCVVMTRRIIPLARRFGSEILLVHVVRPDTDTSPPDFGHRVTNRRDRRQDAWRLTYEFLRPETSGLRVRRVVWEGDPAARIVEGAEAEDCRLIAMATHGARAIPRLVAGSVTAAVLHTGNCPILTTAHLGEDTEAPLGPAFPILCAIDLGPGSTKAIQWACQLGTASSAPVFLLHVTSAADYAMREAEHKAESLLRTLNKSADIAGIFIEDGDLTSIMNARLRRLQARLLVIGRRSRKRSFHPLRCLTFKVVREALCPVVSV